MAGGACAMPARFATLDRLAQFLLLIAAVTCIAHGAFMLAKPLDWYVFVPTVVQTRPPNAHFIRHIRLPSLESGLILPYAASNHIRHCRPALAGGLGLNLYH